LVNYANALRIYADQTAQWANLDSAIEYLRQAVAAAASNDSRRLGHLSDLALALSSRLELRGELIDLDQAIAALEEAVEHTPTGDARLPGRLTNLATCLGLRFECLGHLDDLKAACRAAKASIETTHPDDPRRPGRLSNLGSTLMAAFHAEGSRDRHTIDEAVFVFRKALDTLSADNSWRPRVQTNLGNALRSRAYHFNDLSDLSEAFRLGKEAMEALPAGHPHLALAAYNLAMTLRAVHTLAKDPKYLNAALRLAYAAASDKAAHVAVRAMAAEAWGGWCAMQVPEDSFYVYGAADGYATAVSLLPLLAWRGLHRSSQERVLTRWSTLPALAAAYATESNRVGMALELIELGRAVLWSQVLELRSDLDDLRQVDAELARRLSSLRQRLDNPADGGGAQ
jgi:tetratricopeptide (TPR) repeat protein